MRSSVKKDAFLFFYNGSGNLVSNDNCQFRVKEESPRALALRGQWGKATMRLESRIGRRAHLPNIILRRVAVS